MNLSEPIPLSTMSEFFLGRKVLIASMHGKEKVISPVLERLGMLPESMEGFDTDRFGTFSGEKERQGDPLTVLNDKCIAAYKETGIDLIVASEGSFGPHPSLYFIPADDELILLKDFRKGLEMYVRELSTETNFNFKDVDSEEDLLGFAQDVGFPEHGLILRSGSNSIEKGITSEKVLLENYRKLRGTEFSKIRVETDMRALYNPSRMHVIASAAEKLFQAVSSECPACKMPDFSVRTSIPGLPCSLCGLPTTSSKGFIRNCRFCNYEQVEQSDRITEDPMYCNSCNP